MVEAIRNVVFPAGFVYCEQLADENHLFFAVSTTSHISKKANAIRASSHLGNNLPILTISRLVYVGNSSLTVDITVSDFKTGAALCSFLISMVYIDISTRKPMPLPVWLMEAASKVPRLQCALPAPRLEDFSLPPDMYKYNVKVFHSDIDYNGHAIWSVYVKWCVDAGTDAAENAFYRDFKGNILNYDVEKMEVQYMGEVLVNEEIVVGTWQEESERKILCFAMSSKWTLWSVAEVFQATRAIMFHAGFAYYDQFYDENFGYFVVNTTYVFTKSGNKMTAKSIWGIHSPIIARAKIVHVGASSFTFKTSMFDFKIGVKLCSLSLTFVYIDKRIRKTAKLPAWVAEAKSKNANLKNGLPPRRHEILPVPPNAYTYSVKALHSDIDDNGHINQAVYIKWCSDASTDAAENGLLHGFSRNMGSYDIEKMEVSYVAEGLVNDEFVVATWQDHINLNMIHFIMKVKGKLTFAARFTYFTGDFIAKL